MTIKNAIAREIFDSRGNKTLEVQVYSGSFYGRAAAPSGASVGAHEVKAFPEGGAAQAIAVFNRTYKDKLIGTEISYKAVDRLLSETDPDKKNLGGNLSVALSLATARLEALEKEIQFYELFGGSTLPRPVGNIIGGGVHSGKGSPEIQEFLCIPSGAPSFSEAALANSLVHKKAGEKLSSSIKDFTRGRNDEGAWAPKITIDSALQILTESCQEVSADLGFEIHPGLDVAASEFYNNGNYSYGHKELSPEDQSNYMAELVEHYNIFYLEDPMYEEDFDGFAGLLEKIGKKCLVVADDLTVTNSERLKTSIDKKSCNSIIIKPNQIGSLTETEKVIKEANQSRYTSVVSHRSGETSDNSIAHLAVGFSAPLIKTGVVGGERVAKLNELLRLEEQESRLEMAELII
ncbi:TPA: phosphopyruvate hydratase [archaeon]|nr:phosphopyruvate hydratase [Candidatus Undinarchaeales archaeon SRR5007147.bin71]